MNHRPDAAGGFRTWSLGEDLEESTWHTSGGVARLDPTAADVDRWLRGVENARSGAVLDVDRRIRCLGRIGEVFGDPQSDASRRALTLLPKNAGLSPEMAALVLERMASTWTPDALARLWDQHFLDSARVNGGSRQEPAGVSVLSPQLHIGPGSVPGVTLTSALRGLLLGAAVLSKPGAGDTVLTVMGREILERECPELAARWAVAHWPGSVDTVSTALHRAAALVVYGDNRTVDAYRAAAPASARVVEYGHKASAAVVGVSMADEASAAALAGAVAAYDRRGCVSPQVVYVVGGPGSGGSALWGRVVEWGGRVAGELAHLQARLPAGPQEVGTVARTLQTVGDLEMRAAAGEAVRVWVDPASAWCVLANGTGETLVVPQGRSVQIRPAETLDDAAEGLRSWGSRLQSVGLAVEGAQRPHAAARLKTAGALRVTTLEEMPWPPAWWRHDGAGGLEPLLVAPSDHWVNVR